MVSLRLQTMLRMIESMLQLLLLLLLLLLAVVIGGDGDVECC